jgi:hypothetical protein
MSLAPPTDHVPPPKYKAPGRSRAQRQPGSKRVMSLAGPVTPKDLKDEKNQCVESNIGGRESTWAGVLHHESVVEGGKRYQRDYSIKYSERPVSVSYFLGSDQGDLF